MLYRKLYGQAILMSATLLCISYQSIAGLPNLVLAEVYKANGKNTVEKIEQYSRYFLGLPYGSIAYQQDVSQLGRVEDLLSFISSSEFQYDFDKFDCVTYVETVLALAISGDIDMTSKANFVETFEANLKKIRYKNSQDAYLNRNHFTSVDWIPNNNWLLEDISRGVSKTPEVAKCLIKKDAWLMKQAPVKDFIARYSDEHKEKVIAQIREEINTRNYGFKEVASVVPYVRLEDYLQDPSMYEARLPKLAIINIVRPAWDLEAIIGTKLNISHQGILIKDESGAVKIRHASTGGHKLVMEVALFDYLKAFKESPTIKGFNVLKIKI